MAQVNLQLVTDSGRLGFQVGPETHWMDNDDARQQLRAAILRSQAGDFTRAQLFDAIVVRLRTDGVDPRTATFAQIRNSIQRAPLEVG